MAKLDPALVDRALSEATKRASNLDYFFDQLSSPDWIEPLLARGLFNEPPAQVVDEHGYVRTPAWSASRYLARVAAAAPDAVAKVIRGINSNNERVHEDFIDAALAMPSEIGGVVALDEAAWVAGRDHIYYLLPRKVSELAVHLAGAADIDATVALIRALFAPSDVARDAGWGLKRPQARFSDWEYDQLLRRIVDGIVPVAPATVLAELMNLLRQALEVMRKDEDDAETFDVTSRFWRPRVANDRDRAGHIEDSLISAVRDAARLIRRNHLLTDDDVVALLTSRPEELFARIAMDALGHEPKADIEVVRPFVVDPDEFGDSEPSVEFRELLAGNADRLPPADVERLLDVVQQGPDLDAYRERAKSFGDREATEEEIAKYDAWWRAARLKLLASALDENWLTEYESLRARAGDDELPVSGEVRTFVGPTSPATVEELAEMSDEELLAFLRDWEPEQNWDSPSVDGLARAFAEFMHQNPERITGLALGLRETRPAYVQWTLEGLEGALRDGKTIEWHAVVDLLRWVVDQPREIPGGRGDDHSDLDPGWVWTRKEIASLLERGLTLTREQAIPAALREDIWRVIAAIAEDPDPTAEHEERYGGSNMDPATLALNTTRPRAIRAAVMYAIWLYRAFGFDERAEAGEGVSLFDEAPEVARLLERHLDPKVDPSAAVRAAIGQFYANLVAIDQSWASAVAPSLFPHEDNALREAAWGAYVIYTAPYNNVLSRLRSAYQRSAELAGKPGHGFGWMNSDPSTRLGEHLATFYWRGVIGLDDPLLATFWAAAPSNVRRDVIEFLGRSMRESNDLEPEIADRMIAFWKFARAEAEHDGSTEELQPFGWWFSATALPSEWRLTELADLVRMNIKPDPGFVVPETLRSMANEEPLQAARVLRRLLELERESWALDAWKDEIEQILRIAILSSDEEARRIAEETAHWLGSLGYHEFRALVA